MSAYSWPTSPVTSSSGMNTTTLVKVEPSSAGHTSTVPSIAARTALLPRCKWVNTFSMTTMALSTIIPTENASPARLMMLRLRPSSAMTLNTLISVTGIVTTTTATVRSDPRNSTSASVASAAPVSRLPHTSCTAWPTYSLSS